MINRVAEAFVILLAVVVMAIFVAVGLATEGRAAGIETKPGDERSINVREKGAVVFEDFVIRGDGGKHIPLIIYKDPGQKVTFLRTFVNCGPSPKHPRQFVDGKGKPYTEMWTMVPGMYWAANDMAISFCPSGVDGYVFYMTGQTSEIEIKKFLFVGDRAQDKEPPRECWFKDCAVGPYFGGGKK